MPKVYHTVQFMQPSLFSLSAKVCNVCLEEKPLDTDHFVRDRSKKDGYREMCKTCYSARRKMRYDANPEPHRVRSRVNRVNNLEYHRAYNRAYRPIKNAKERERYATDEAYRQKKKARNKLEDEKHPENRQGRLRRYRQKNLQQFCEYAVRRYARKLGATIDEVDYMRVLERDGLWCYICEQVIDPQARDKTKLSFDHVIPLARNGAHSEENIKPVHQCCNSRKHTRLLEEMTPYQRRGPHA